MAKNNRGASDILDAARDGDLQTIKKYIAAKKDLNAQGPDGRTLLINACANHHGEIIEMLIDAGADANRVTNSKKTILNYTLCPAFGFNIGGKRGDTSVLDIVKLLLAQRCTVSSFDIASAILFQTPEVLTALLKRVSQNKNILIDAVDYVNRNAFEYDVDESTYEKNLNLVQNCLKRI